MRNSIYKDWNDSGLIESVIGFSLKQSFSSSNLMWCACMEEGSQIHSLNVNTLKKREKIDPTLERSLQKVKSHFVWHLDVLEMKLSSNDLNQESTRRLSGSPKISNITWEYLAFCCWLCSRLGSSYVPAKYCGAQSRKCIRIFPLFLN